jgi:hypothetical protein
MKKAISIVFLLLATIAILAHAVVPHHHHDGIAVALFESHCTDCSESHHDDHDHECNHEANPHQHENDNTLEQCALNKVYIRSDSSPKIINLVSFDCGQSLLFILSRIIDKLGLANEVGLPFQQKPYIESYHVIFSSNSIGLRAPPVC